MTTGPQDTEITLGTGRMLALFFSLVLVCAVFFAIGFSLGRKTTMLASVSSPGAVAGSPAAIVRPSAAAAKSNSPQTTTPVTDFSFYKTVGQKSADVTPSPAASQPQPPSAAPVETPPDPAAVTAPASGNYFVQVAAVSRQEDADALVEALKKKQYPAFTASNQSADKFYHVQVGPYAELKDAEAMRARLITDGYSPIVKK
jgi:cell division septation protein DedD